MSKKRRTKKDKVAASERALAHVHSQNSSGQISLSISSEYTPSHSPLQTTMNASRSHTYVAKDIKNTLLITTIILATNIAIFIVLKLSIVNLFGIVF